MYFTTLLERLTAFYYHYPLLSLGLGVAVLIWAYLKPKQAMKGLLFLGFVAIVFYVLSLMQEGTGASISSKEKMIHRTEKALE